MDDKNKISAECFGTNKVVPKEEKSSSDDKILAPIGEEKVEKNVDEVLEMVGSFDRFQWLVEVLMIFMVMPHVFQIYATYFTAIEPNWKCVENSTACPLTGTHTNENDLRCSIPKSEWEFVTPKHSSIVVDYRLYCDDAWLISLTSSIFFFGNFFGYITFGWLSDIYGRKRILFPCFAILLCFSLLSTAMPNIGWFLFCRFVIGFVGSGYANQASIVISEFNSMKHRSLANNMMWIFWSCFYCLLALQAYLIHDWKILFVVCSAPYFIGIIGLKFLPESGRWLQSKGRTEKAMVIFKRVAAWNKRVLEMDFKLAPALVTHTKSSPLDLFKTKKLAIPTIIQCFLYFVNAMGYFGISLAADDLGGSLYLNFVYVSLVEIPSAICAIDFCNRFGRRRTSCCAILTAGVFCLIIPLIPTSTSTGITTRIILGVLGKFFVTLSYDSVFTWSLELYPTNVRSSGIGVTSFAASIGSTSSPWIAKSLKVFHDGLPFYVMGSLAVIAGFVGFLLPETKGINENDLFADLH